MNKKKKVPQTKSSHRIKKNKSKKPATRKTKKEETLDVSFFYSCTRWQLWFFMEDL